MVEDGEGNILAAASRRVDQRLDPQMAKVISLTIDLILAHDLYV